MDSESIIVAVSSPPGRSVRGLIRTSGAGVFDLLRSMSDVSEQEPIQRGARPLRLRTPMGELPVLALLFPAPGSYTGDDTVELLTVGNPTLLEQVIDALIARGRACGRLIRRAEAGEFTARAFFNRRLSLTQAEGIAATIAAQSDAQLRAAAQLRDGSLGRTAIELADQLASALALVEASIDFTDQEDVIAITPADLRERVLHIIGRIDDVLSRATGFEAMDAIPRVVLVGPPNAGKSTLFNALLGRARAVVSNVAGTTRDVLAEPLHVPTAHGDAEVLLVDIAGLDSEGVLEHPELHPLMQEAARTAIDRADLLVTCTPADEPIPAAWVGTDKPTIHVRTKIDLADESIADAVRGEALLLSAHTGEGLDALRTSIGQRLGEAAVFLAADAMALQPRHEAALRQAAAHLREAIGLIRDQPHAGPLEMPELVANVLRSALDDLGELAGDLTPDDVLGRIFASFCVGK